MNTYVCLDRADQHVTRRDSYHFARTTPVGVKVHHGLINEKWGIQIIFAAFMVHVIEEASLALPFLRSQRTPRHRTNTVSHQRVASDRGGKGVLVVKLGHATGGVPPARCGDVHRSGCRGSHARAGTWKHRNREAGIAIAFVSSLLEMRNNNKKKKKTSFVTPRLGWQTGGLKKDNMSHSDRRLDVQIGGG